MSTRTFTFNVTAPQTGTPTWLQGLAVGQYTRICTLPGTLREIVNAYSGAAWNPTAKTFYIHGGGHNNSSDNSVWAVDISQNAPAVSVIGQPTDGTGAAVGSFAGDRFDLRAVEASYASTGAPVISGLSPTAFFTANGQYYKSGGDWAAANRKPVSTHTYQHLVYVPETNKMMRMGCVNGFGGNPGPRTGQMDGFNVATGQWDAPLSYLHSTYNAHFGANEYSPVARDPSTGRVYWMSSTTYYGTNQTAILAYNQLGGDGTFYWHPSSPNTRVRLGNSAQWSSGMGIMAIDHTTRNRLLYVVKPSSGSAAYATSINLANGAATPVTLSDFSFVAYDSANYSAMVYAEELDAYLYLTNRGETLHKIDAGTYAVTTLATGLPRKSVGDGINNKFAWVPEYGGVAWICDGTTTSAANGVWFYKVQ